MNSARRTACLWMLAAGGHVSCALAHGVRAGSIEFDHPYAVVAEDAALHVHVRRTDVRSGRPDHVVQASSPVASRTRFQRRQADGLWADAPALPLPTGRSGHWRHDGSWRIRLEGLVRAWAEGDRFDLDLTLASGAHVRLNVWVQQPRRRQ